MDKANETKTQSEFENNVIEAVVTNAEVDVPKCMVDARIDDMLKDFGYRLSSQGLNLEQYMQMTGSTVDSFKDMYKDQAAQQVKTTLVLETIAAQENIEVTDEDMEKELEAMATMYGMELDKVKTLVGDNEKESIRADLKVRKAVKLIADEAKIGKPKSAKKTAKKVEKTDEKPAKAATKKTAKKSAEGETKPKKTTAKKVSEKAEDKAE